MNVYELILKRRTIRKFKQQELPEEVLKKLVNAARVAPQAANMQPLKYIVINDEKLLELIFATTSWAGYIRPQGDPQEGEKPAAYIVILVDTEIKKAGYDVDAGAAVENIILTALEAGIGSCWLGAINKDKIKEILSIPDKYIIHTMLALGYPLEEPVMEEENGSIKYYKDETGKLHVPKRKLEDVMFFNNFIK
jgi:nitroreductase